MNAGQIDKSFGDAGIVSFPTGVQINQIFDQSDGRILAIGTENKAPFAERFLPHGQVDPTFGQTNIQSLVSGTNNEIVANALDSEDRLLVAINIPSITGSRLFRFNTKGEIDRKFGLKGKVNIPLTSVAHVFSLPDGRIIVSGNLHGISNGFEDFSTPIGIVVLNNDGTIDKTFNQIGIATVGETAFDNEVDFVSSSGVGNEAVFPLPNHAFLYLLDVEGERDFSDPLPDETDIGSTITAHAFNRDGSIDSSFPTDNLQDSTGWLQSGSAQLPAIPKASIHFVRLLEESNDTQNNRLFDAFADTLTTKGKILETPLIKGISGPHLSTLQESNGKLFIQTDASTLIRFDPNTGNQESFPIDTANLDSISAQIQTNDGQILAAFQKQGASSLVKLQDTDSPTGTLQAQPLRTSKSTSYRFSITWQDDKSVAWKTLGSGDVVVDFPDGSEHTAKLISINKHHNSGIITATYTVAPPNGAWDSAENGTYTIFVRDNHIWDTEGNAAAGRQLGEFNIQIPPQFQSAVTTTIKHRNEKSITQSVLP